MGIRHLLEYNIFGVPLYIICACGLMGVLPDLDHLVQAVWMHQWKERWFHIPLFTITCIVSLLVGAYVRRLYMAQVLRKEK